MKVRDAISLSKAIGWVLGATRGSHRQEEQICDAICFHIDGLEADGLPVPAPTSIADYVDA